MLSLLLSVALAAPAPPSSPVIITPTAPPSSGPSVDLQRGAVRLTPEEAIRQAASAPNGVSGVFELTVRRAEQVGQNFFLGTQDDYRDPRNLAIRITRPVQLQLRRHFGPDLKAVFVGKRLLITGRAKSTRIAYLDSAGRRTGRYYHQTHVEVRQPLQIEFELH